MIRGITCVAVCNFDTCAHVRAMSEREGEMADGKVEKQGKKKKGVRGRSRAKQVKPQKHIPRERPTANVVTSGGSIYTRGSNQPPGPVVWTVGRRRPQPIGKSSPRPRTPVSHPVHPPSTAGPTPTRLASSTTAISLSSSFDHINCSSGRTRPSAIDTQSLNYRRLRSPTRLRRAWGMDLR